MGKELLENLPSYSTSWESAKKIMGNRAIGIEAAGKIHLETKDFNIQNYNVVPFSKEELASSDRNSILLAVPEVNLSTLTEVAKDFYWGLAPLKGDFVTTKARPGYHIFTIPPKDISYKEMERNSKRASQLSLPYVSEVAYFLGVWQAIFKKPPTDHWIFCSDVDEGGWKIFVHTFKDGKVEFDCDSDYGGYINPPRGVIIPHYYRDYSAK